MHLPILAKRSKKPKDDPIWLDMSRYPTLVRATWVKRFLLGQLPVELVDMVVDDLDKIEYWMHSTSTMHTTYFVPGNTIRWDENKQYGFVCRCPPIGSLTPSVGTRPNATSSKWLSSRVLRSMFKRVDSSVTSRPPSLDPTQPQPRGPHPVRMIIFEVLTHQRKVTQNSWNAASCRLWIDVRVWRPPSQDLAASKHATSLPTAAPTEANQQDNARPWHYLNLEEGLRDYTVDSPKHCLIWRHDDGNDDGKFILGLRTGDEIGLWIRAARSDMHLIEGVRMHVFWAFK